MTISLIPPSPELYEELYDKRFRPIVTKWADSGNYEVSKSEYTYHRYTHVQHNIIIEKIIAYNNIPIGTITASNFSLDRSICTLGIVIVDPEYWNKGYGTIAMKLFTFELAFNGFKQILLETYANNLRAIKAFKKIGFKIYKYTYSHKFGRKLAKMKLDLENYKTLE